MFVPISERNFQSETITVLSRSRRALPIAAEVFVEQLATALGQIAPAGQGTEGRLVPALEPM